MTNDFTYTMKLRDFETGPSSYPLKLLARLLWIETVHPTAHSSAIAFATALSLYERSLPD